MGRKETKGQPKRSAEGATAGARRNIIAGGREMIVINESYAGKAKGMKRVLWECGW